MFGSSKYKIAKRNVHYGYRRNSNTTHGSKYVYRSSSRKRKK